MPVPAPVAPPKVIRQRRMRPGLLGLAVLLIALGGLGAAFAITSVKATGSYLAVARQVPQGTALTADDLVTVQVAGGAGLAPVPASQQAQVVGKRAAVPLVPGSLLTMAQLTDKPLLSQGQQQVALGLRANQVPARRLLPGDRVILVGTPEKGEAPAVTRYDATVIDMALDRTNATVYLALKASDVAAVVLLADADRIAVVLTPGA
ncbi:SAF domain-containing protein [Asanoa sp. WMMD1127]|uniref:SAF domain-containing protein n=1 Tax=Asanoa sp. WMMD1127 TaxID=3016107 RepID=UPI0024176496|nr:SAF domain-containing protein [Asanoa sp. WMMD1127]MDG4821865.1 SAF domain-containing protein [Asanoa sp. WMMD1127]